MEKMGETSVRKKTILIVDDAEVALKLAEDILKPKGYRIIKARSGEEALKILKKIKPDLILLDFFMPKMSGGEVCERIRRNKRLRNVKVVFLTIARFSRRYIDNMKKMKVLDYIKKPFDNRDLRRRVKKAIG